MQVADTREWAQQLARAAIGSAIPSSRMASHGELELVVHEVLPLEQAVLAHQKMDAGEVFGRIVLVPRVERP